MAALCPLENLKEIWSCSYSSPQSSSTTTISTKAEVGTGVIRPRNTEITNKEKYRYMRTSRWWFIRKMLFKSR